MKRLDTLIKLQYTWMTCLNGMLPCLTDSLRFFKKRARPFWNHAAQLCWVPVSLMVLGNVSYSETEHHVHGLAGNTGARAEVLLNACRHDFIGHGPIGLERQKCSVALLLLVVTHAANEGGFSNGGTAQSARSRTSSGGSMKLGCTCHTPTCSRPWLLQAIFSG